MVNWLWGSQKAEGKHGRLEMDRGTIGIYRDGNAVRTVEVGEEHARVRYRRQ